MFPLLQIKDLMVSFPGESRPAVDGISLEIGPGELVALVGESGSGKSVTALSVLQLLPAAAGMKRRGQILFSDDGAAQSDLTALSPAGLRAVRGNRIGMIFQEPMTSLNPVMTCGKQVEEGLRLHRKMTAANARGEVLRLFEKVRMPDPAGIFDRFPHELSGGQKQRVMIAMAISCRPALLICDEPTTALDVTVQQTIVQLLRGLALAERMGMLFITHDLGLVADMADRVAVMYRGRLVETGPARTVLGAPAHPYTRGLVLCRPVLHRKGERLPLVSDFWDGENPGAGLPPPPSEFSSPGAVSCPADTDSAAVPQVLLRAENLMLQYNRRSRQGFRKGDSPVDAVREASFEIFRGETLGLVGESGCGKSTLGRALLRLKAPVSGTLTYAGQDLLALSPALLRAFRRRLQIVFQDPYSSLNPGMKIGPAIMEAVGLFYPRLTAAARRDKMLDMLQRVDLLPAHADRYPHAFSGGQRQRIVIARALAVNPEFVVFDEPVSALDVSVQAQVLNLLNDLKRTLGFTAVFISHDLSVVRYLCDRILVMEKGRIVESGDTETVCRSPRTDYTRRLLAAVPGRTR